MTLLFGSQDAAPVLNHAETDRGGAGGGGGGHKGTDTETGDSITEPGWVRGLVDVWASLEEGVPVEEEWGELCLNHLRYKRDTCYSVKRDLVQCQKRPVTVSKETYYNVKRDLLQCQQRPITMSKETYYIVKRDLLHCQKRPITVSKETYYNVQRDLLQCQKKPVTVSKETYYSVK